MSPCCYQEKTRFSGHNVRGDPIAPDATYLDKLWVPDLFFNNEKSSRFHDITLKVNQEGEKGGRGKVSRPPRVRFEIRTQMAVLRGISKARVG